MNGKAIVKNQREVERNILLLELEAPQTAAKAKPGQFVMLRATEGLDPLLARPFSIHDVNGGTLSILYKVVGKGTGLMRNLRPGQSVALWGPLGRAFALGQKKPVLVGGGMGVAPLNFAAKRLAQLGTSAPILCGLPGTSGFGGLIGLMTDCADGTGCALSWATEDGSLGCRGFVTNLLDQALDGCDGVLSCGPLPMLKAVAEVCAQHGVPCQVSLEARMACGVGACLGCAAPASGGGYLRVCQDGPVFDAADMDWTRFDE